MLSTNVKAMIVVLALAIATFWFARPIALLFSDERDFARRRNVWLVLTVVGFLSSSFWIFVLIAAPLLYGPDGRTGIRWPCTSCCYT